MKISSLDELPKFSQWPARLLGLVPWSAKEKTPDEIEREFGREKWGALLERFKATPGARLDDVDRWAAGDDAAKVSLASVDQHIVEMTAEESHEAYLAYIMSALEPHIAEASAIVELGCGYGSVILGLARKAAFQDLRYFAADFTSTGPELAGLIAKSESIPLTTGRANLKENPVTDLRIPEGALIYTAYAAQYVEPLTDAFIEGVAALKPRAVVHIEPVYEHCDPSTLLGLLRQRYIQANGYNRNLSTILHDHEARGSLEIVHESKPGFGPNPLLAASVIAWVPRG
ncbi:MAG TPA: class I SAM-dependent methyltransferase [Gemmatimonadaceae bacterium]